MKRFFLILNLVIFIGLVRSNAQDTLELATAILFGLENNFDIKISEGQKNIASNNNTYGNAGFLPTLDLSSAQRYTLENTSQVFISGDEQNRDGAKSNNFSAGAAFNWILFDGTTMFYTKDRLEELEKQGIAITESVIQNIVSQIAKEFYTVALEQIRLGLLFQNIGLSEDRLEIAKNKYEFGKSSKMEYLQAQVDLNRDKSNHMIQQENLASSKTALNELLGRDVTLDFYVFFDPELNTSLQYEELNAAMENNNPELLANRYEMSASKLVEKELSGERIPELGFNLGYNYAKSEAEAGFLLSRRSKGITYGVSATWNLFDGLNLNRRIQNAKIIAENTELNYEAIKLSLEKELYSTFISYQNNIQLYSMEEQNKEVATENNEIAIERYRVGTSSPLELREAQINLLEANLRYLNAAYFVKTGEIDLLFLSGSLLK
ncbi:MAG: TolC family protein [Cyclobacteriaceae bacterium]|nr:TolC family protein [Cyclobacteriaceae bacterium]